MLGKMRGTLLWMAQELTSATSAYKCNSLTSPLPLLADSHKTLKLWKEAPQWCPDDAICSSIERCLTGALARPVLLAAGSTGGPGDREGGRVLVWGVPVGDLDAGPAHPPQPQPACHLQRRHAWHPVPRAACRCPTCMVSCPLPLPPINASLAGHA